MLDCSRSIVVGLLVAGGLVVAGSGCEAFKPRGTKGKEPGGPIEPKTREQLVNYLNNQGEKLNGVRFPSVALTIDAGKEHHTLPNGNLICSKPRNFSLVAGKVVWSELVQIGSNSSEFWMYSRFPEPTYLYCSHADYQRGSVQTPFPFDPDWALQALGMSYYDPNQPYRVELDQPNREQQLIFDTQTPQGKTIRRVVVFAADNMGDAKPQVRKHLILDDAGKPIASATISEVTTVAVPGSGNFVQLPTRVTLDWPQQQFTMEMRMKNPRVNEPISESDQQQLFTKPTIPGATPKNLAAMRFHSGVFRAAPPARFEGERGTSIP